MFDITEDSAPGPDGYTSAFFKASWSVVGQEVSAAIREFFRSGKILKQINATLLVLIPKVQMPSQVADYRPISCCNVIYKTITKLIVNRMQQVLDLLIDHSQNAFVPGRNISDNILLAQKLLGGYNQMRLPPRCTIKVDLQKAYNSVEWDFLLEALKLFNFPTRFIAGLSNVFQLPHSQSPLMDRSMVFSRAEIDSIQVIKDTLWPEGFLPVRYLGVPLISSRLKIADCKPLIDKLDSRIAGWSHLNLSFAGRAQLIQSVLSTLHSYWASVFILPKGIIKILEAKLRKFLWQGATRRGQAKVAWDQVCRQTEEGCLGFRSILVMNKALMMKHLWKIVRQDRKSIWVAWILRHRLHNDNLWTFNGSTGSWGWKKLIKLRPVLKSRLIYQVGWGNLFKLWQDIWYEQGSLSYPQGPTITGLPLGSLLSSVLQNGQWHWPAQNDTEILGLWLTYHRCIRTHRTPSPGETHRANFLSNQQYSCFSHEQTEWHGMGYYTAGTKFLDMYSFFGWLYGKNSLQWIKFGFLVETMDVYYVTSSM
ncbi:hypothetical protein Sango_1307100 [Sesamum angolense]|uniref:Reverse transcriptase domain-containing protein n=1 Tax=Sesamum angolense TaxID=2727404 RepID=A0AAE2BUL4_9LAMI|nr:hypothetical protein Sango_1307100 [Sesamum angolense]